jgi:hypothetical protein
MGDLAVVSSQPVKYQRTFAVLTVLLCCLGTAAAQLVEFRADGLKCMHSGLSSGLKNCDVPNWYAYAFVGTISAVTPVENGESEIRVTPEEVFHGNPGTSLTVRTSQGACLPKLVVGDRWLFFLRDAKPLVLDYYGNDSRPVADVQEKIETLRRLQNIGDLGVLRGHVQRGSYIPFIQYDAVPSAHVIARRTSDNAQFVTLADAEGRYEFPPVPPGKYKLTVEGMPLLDGDGGELTVSRGACWDITIELPKATDGSISGHVGSPDGKPFIVHPWVQIVSADSDQYKLAYVDANGNFEARGLEPGRYLVGLGIRPGSGYFSDVPSPIYYPGVRNKEQAAIIDLRPAEKRTQIDFQLPIEDVLKPLGQATSKH